MTNETFKSSPDSVLIVDDDTELCAMLDRYLSGHGWKVLTSHSGEDGIRTALEANPDLIILDVMLPDIEGFEVLKRLHRIRTFRVLLLTARGEEIDRIVGLEMGADDYLGKPFNPRELMARMKAVLRRSAGRPNVSHPSPLNDFSVDSVNRQITYRYKAIALTDVEFDLMTLLLQQEHGVWSRDELSHAVFQRPSRPFDRSVDMHISRLRRKLDGLEGFAGEIRAVRNSGYMLAMNVDITER